jgi:hypothetical protein
MLNTVLTSHANNITGPRSVLAARQWQILIYDSLDNGYVARLGIPEVEGRLRMLFIRLGCIGASVHLGVVKVVLARKYLFPGRRGISSQTTNRQKKMISEPTQWTAGWEMAGLTLDRACDMVVTAE